MASLEVEVFRGGLFETRHDVSAVLVEGGQVRWSAGDDVASFWRSASKPFQLLSSLRALPAAVVDALDDASLALGAASHSGQVEHTTRVAELLRYFSLSEHELQCGAHPPMHEGTAKVTPVPTVLHSNCSGKHTFMLAACAAQGWERDYRPLSHPLQQRNQAVMDELAGLHHPSAVDGCSVPTFHAPLSAQARAWCRLAEAMAGGGDALLGRIGNAMNREPFFMSGSERLDLLVVQNASERVAVKVGAEGLFCVALPVRRQGLAVKVHSGNSEALAVAVKGVLEELGVHVAGPWPWSVVKNVRDVSVGARAFRLKR